MRRGARRLAAGVVASALGCALLAGCSDDTGEGESASATAAVESAAVLDPWFDAVRRSDETPARAVVLGDSVSEGYGLSDHLERRWVDRLQAGLRERAPAADCPTTPGGWHGTTSLVPADYRAGSLPDPAVSGRVLPAPTLGPGGRAVTLGPGGSISWTVEAESVDLGYRTRFAGGPLQIEIDGRVVETALSTDTDPRAERRVWSSGDLGPGEHTVTARNTQPTSGSRTATVTDLTPLRGDRDRCVHVLDASRSGVSAQTIAQTPTYLKDSLSLDPDLLVVPLGFNDRRAGIPADDFGPTLDSLVQQTRGMGYDGPIILVGWFTPAPDGTQPGWPGYLRQMHAATSHEGVSFVDLSAVLPPADPTTPWYIDGLHPSAAGQPLIADSLTGILAPPDRGTSTTPAASADPS